MILYNRKSRKNKKKIHLSIDVKPKLKKKKFNLEEIDWCCITNSKFTNAYWITFCTGKQVTRWCLKKVFNDTQASPICWNMVFIFVKDPPANSVAMQMRKFPAGSLVPGIKGWLVQVNSFLQPGLLHVDLMVTAVPDWVAVTSGLFPVRQKWQNWKSRRSLDRNTMCFGSVLMSLLLDSGILQ